MKKNVIYSCLIAVLLLSPVSLVFSQQNEAASWKQFRGNNRNGISSEKGMVSWSENAPQMVWKKEIGQGFSEIVISGNEIYTMFGEKLDSITGTEYIASFDAKTGNEIWKTKVDSIFIDIDNWGDGSRSTPIIDGDYLYCLSSFGKLTALSRKDGKMIWQVDFVAEYGSTVPRWGFSTSPLLIDDMLVIETGGTESRALTAFDKKNGKEIWSNGDWAASYTSPILATIEGKKQIIIASNVTLYSFDIKGDTLWTKKIPVSTPTALPLFIAPNKIFISSIRGIGFFIAEVKNNKATEFLKGNSMKNDFSSSCYRDGYIYGFNVATLQCVSAETGEKKWTKRGFGKGSLVLVDDKLFVLSDQGKLIQVEAKPDAYTENGSIPTIKGKSWTAPSFADGKIYVRNLTEMACYKVTTR